MGIDLGIENILAFKENDDRLNMSDLYDIVRAETPTLIVSRSSLPTRKTAYIMMPGGA